HASRPETGLGAVAQRAVGQGWSTPVAPGRGSERWRKERWRKERWRKERWGKDRRPGCECP
ncbi:MAG TPA: hypothetical protein VM366_20175, partial [Anaerolineae bacterium]|nr:hypothetical protein [Anaerolineae bacterium]